MGNFFQKEYHCVKESQVIYPIRLFFQCFGLLHVCQWLYSAGDSFYRTGELNIVWRADWIFTIAPILWVLYLITIILLGKAISTTTKHPK